MAGNENKNKRSILLIILGCLGMIATIVIVAIKYIYTKDIKTIMLILAIGFVPFVISFSFIKLGVKTLDKKNV